MDILEKLMRDVRTKSIQGMPNRDGAALGTHWPKSSIAVRQRAKGKPALLPTMQDTAAHTIGKSADPLACLKVESATKSKSIHSKPGGWWLLQAAARIGDWHCSTGRATGQY